MPSPNTHDRKRFLNDLAVAYGRSMQQKETGFVHNGATIVFYENLCFALALLKTRSVENVLEAKKLLEKLFAFDSFPVRLHEHPVCRDFSHPVRLLVPLLLMDREFSPHVDVKKEIGILWEKAKQAPESSVKRALAHLLDGAPRPESDPDVYVAELLEEDGGYEKWNSHLGFFPETPEISLADYAMALKENLYPKRLLEANPLHLQLSLLSPREPKEKISPPTACVIDNGFTFYFGNRERLCHLSSGGVAAFDNFRFTYPETLPEEGKEVELFVDWTFDRQSFPLFNGERSIVGYLGDRVTVRAAGLEIELVFSLVEGSGDFTIHLSKKEGDLWTLGVRTLRRSEKLAIECAVNVRQFEGEACRCQFFRLGGGAFKEELVGSLSE